ncbi:MAG: hypothetical protein JWO77_1050 [Ilumatobacteraceae bacterium]|nr:hypothetical protein [Ilumatobacteraceae bacterium]
MAAIDTELAGKRLRRWRDEQNWSGPETAEKAGLTWSELRPIELGEAEYDPQVLGHLARSFGKSLADLLGPPLAEDLPPAEPTRPPDDRPQQLQERSPYRPGVAHATVSEAWDLVPGDTIVRIDLHRRYGGNKQSGIAPSAQSPNIMIFSDPGGNEHGYYDRWDNETGVFLYSGEGQRGDQTMDKGNRAILNHRRDGRALRVFEGSGGRVRYAGEFEVASTQPYVIQQSHESGSARMRKVFVFRLVPADDLSTVFRH